MKRLRRTASLLALAVAAAGVAATAEGAAATTPTAAAHNGIQTQQTTHTPPRDISGNMTYHGGTNDGSATIGVTTGPPKVYIVYWGSQWGTASTDANGYTAFSTDTKGAAPKQQGLFKGLGTNSETWSGVLTQYCEGVPAGAGDCSAQGAAHVGYPTGGALAGVWYDNAAAEPSNATGHDLAQEAVNAAAHFGNTTPASNRNAQYIITSPFGTHPDGFTIGSGFCAWHSWNGDSNFLGSKGGTVSSSFGDIPFANMPGDIANASGCSGGGAGGFTAVNSHEYAETLTDQLTNFANNPTGGWFDGSGNENADKCQTDIGNLTLATGTFSVEPTWSNEDNSGQGACSFSDPVVGGPPAGSVTVASPGGQTNVVGDTVSLALKASGGTAPYTWSATGLPAGLSITASTGVISGAPTAAGSSDVTVTATDSSSPANTGSASFSWLVNPAGGGTGGVANGGFENGGLAGWTTGGSAAVVSSPVHSGSHAARLGSTTATGTSTLKQTFTAGTAQLSLWYRQACSSFGFGSLVITLKDATTGSGSTLLSDFCASDSAYRQLTAPVTAGHSYTLTVTNNDSSFSGSYATVYLDDIAA